MYREVLMVANWKLALLSICVTFTNAFMHGRPLVSHSPTPTAFPFKLRAVSMTVIDPSFNLAAGALVVGTLAGGLEDIVKVINQLIHPFIHVYIH